MEEKRETVTNTLQPQPRELIAPDSEKRAADSATNEPTLPMAAARNRGAASRPPTATIELPSELPDGSSGFGVCPIPGYTILREIHRGGQGEVYRAVQNATQQPVAIKVINKGEFAGPMDKARFDLEIRILGQIKHPNIVTIHDSGMAEGRNYYVMDYIAGRSLHEYMAHLREEHKSGSSRSGEKDRAERSSVRGTLQLFHKICEAVNAAHLRGVTHRDLKPNNIRITDAGEPHVLDFGLAKVAGGDAGAIVENSGEFIGTRQWASPEQAEGRPSKIDVRTDVYALGLILYHMLTGKFPYDVSGGLDEVRDRIIRAEPVRPSVALAEDGGRKSEGGSSSWNLLASSWRRAFVPQKISDDVEKIVLKCLAKERERRYQSAGELARDIQHYLVGDPVEAKRDSLGYVLRKAAGRYKVPTAVAAGYVAVITISLILVATQWSKAVQQRTLAVQAQEAEEKQRLAAEDERDRAQRAEKLAMEETARANTYKRLLGDSLGALNPKVAKGADITLLKTVFDDVARRAAEELEQQPVVEADVRAWIGELYEKLSRYQEAIPHLETAVEIRRRLFGDQSAEVSDSLLALGLVYKRWQQFPEAEARYQESISIARALKGDDDPDVAMRLNYLGLLQLQGQPQDITGAEASFRDALRIYLKAFGADHERAAIVKGNIGLLYADAAKSQHAEAVKWYREAISILEKVDNRPEAARCRNNLAESLLALGDVDEAERECRKALDSRRKLHPEEHNKDGHMALVSSLGVLGDILSKKGKPEEAKEAYAAALRMAEALQPPDSKVLIKLRDKLAAIP